MHCTFADLGSNKVSSSSTKRSLAHGVDINHLIRLDWISCDGNSVWNKSEYSHNER